MPHDPFAPPPPEEHDYRQKTPDCKHRETPAEREDNRARGVFGAADCTREHVCNLYVGHRASRHRARKCGHWFGPDAETPESARAAYLAEFPPCDCGSVDKHGDDLGEHDASCPYHRAAVAAFGIVDPHAFEQYEAPAEEVPHVGIGVNCAHCGADIGTAAHIGDSARRLFDEHLKTCPEAGSFGAIERASVSFDTPTPCPSWIWIDGGNDRATCDQPKGHDGEEHTRYGVPPWTDADHARAVATSWED